MKIHETTIKKYNGTLEELAKDIADLRYDALYELLTNISNNITQDSQKDLNRGRILLASNLVQAGGQITIGAISILKAWKICKKHMKDENNE